MTGTPPPTSSLRSFWEKLPPGQQMVASILSFIFAVPVLGVLAGGRLAGIAAILMPLGIVWSVLYFRAKQREQQQRFPNPQAQMYTPPQPTAFYSSTQSTAYHPPQQPVTAQPPPPMHTNPLEASQPYPGPPSVTEEETQRLPPPPRQVQ